MCVSVKFATVWNCGKSSSCFESFVALVLNDWPCCLFLLLLRSQRAYVNNHFVRPSVCRPRLSALSVSAAARNFVGKLRLMIMFNELYNKYIAAAAASATEAAATAHGTWTPKIAGTLRKVPELMSLSLSFCLHHLSLPLCELCLPLLHLTATLIQLGAAVIYEKQRQRGLTRAAHSAGPSA